MIVSVHQPQYLPWLGYFHKIDRSDIFVFLDNVQYKEREYQNRNKIRTKDGWMWLTVPVISKGLGRQKIGNVRIDNAFNWRKHHRDSLLNHYSRAPFFKDYWDFFEGTYSSVWEKLPDLNVHIIKYILAKLKIHTAIYYESELCVCSRRTDRIVDICRRLEVTTYLSGSGGKEYLKEEKFIEAGIKLEYQDFLHPVYRQRYASETGPFLPFMSAVDLLFNEGDRALHILRGEVKYV